MFFVGRKILNDIMYFSSRCCLWLIFIIIIYYTYELLLKSFNKILFIYLLMFGFLCNYMSIQYSTINC